MKCFQIVFIIIFSLLISTTLIGQQLDSLDYFSFYPMHIGDKWFYKTSLYETGTNPEISYHCKEIIGDTLLPNGIKYFIVSEYDRIHYERIDSLNFEVKNYSNSSCDSIDVSIFPLKFYKDSIYVWYNCENFPYEVSYFDSSEALPEPHIKLVSDYLVNSVFYIQKGLGIRYHDVSEISYSNTTLIGALIDGKQWGTFTNLKKNENPIPVLKILSKNYPNPFNPESTIEYYIPKPGKTSITIYNVLDEIIKIFEMGFQDIGNYKIIFNGRKHPSGVYYYKIKSGDLSEIKSMILIK